MRDGLIAFEQHQDQLPARGRDPLVGALLRIPPLVERYHGQLAGE